MKPSSLRPLSPLVLILLAAPGAPAQSARRKPAPTRPAARWVGQDGTDRVGPAPAPAPNGIQDIRIALAGLPAQHAIASARITGLGGGEWQSHPTGTTWCVAVVRQPSTSTADLYFEPPGPEAGRPFRVELKLDDGRTLTLDVRGGEADPNLRAESAKLKATWAGQDGNDHCGPTAAVGPDGHQDVHLSLTNLAANVEIREAAIDAPASPGWRSGPNPRRKPNAEIDRRGPDADLWFQPDRDLAGVPLTVTITYADGKTDQATVKAARTDPKRRVPTPPAPTFIPSTIRARWLGQDGTNRVGPGDVRVELTGLPPGRRIAAAALSNAARGSWAQRLNESVPFAPEPGALPLHLDFHPESNSADLRFPPDRDESNTTLLLRLGFNDGQATLLRIPGGPCDPALRAGVEPATSRTTARPGANLHDLVNRFGAIHLSPGTYNLDRPLVLEKPITLTADPGAELVFSQPAGAEPWTAAIKLRAGRTTLEGFAVRFAGPIRWRDGLQDGPAVIGTTDNFDPPQRDLLADLRLRRLDLDAPPASGAAPWEPAPRLARLRGASCGRIEENTLRGGLIEFWGGPWTVRSNTFRGTPPRTSSPAVFAAHEPHDLVVSENRTLADPSAGKTWRFLVITGAGANLNINHNTIEGIGPRDADTIPNDNAPELLLTESYALHFEGKPAAISPDGRLLLIPPPQGEPARTGSVVAILEGPHSGSWHRIEQALDARTYLVDPPLPKGEYAVSLASGFLATAIEHNRIDARGGSVAVNMVLAGNHFGTRVRNNTFLGAGDAFRIVACATERPSFWGWSHAPVFGLDLSGNTVEASRHGGLVTVEHGPPVKSSTGRVYLTARSQDNTGPIRLGEPGADPGEMAITRD